jgi:hypothetical protein
MAAVASIPDLKNFRLFMIPGFSKLPQVLAVSTILQR